MTLTSRSWMAWLTARMQAIIRGNYPFTVRTVSAEEARALFADQPYKLALIDGLLQGAQDEYGNEAVGGEPPALTVYQQDHFIDLCRGPHVATTGAIDPRRSS